MDGANDRSVLVRQVPQQSNARRRCHFVESTGGLVEEHNLWICDELKGDGESLFLAAAQRFRCRRLSVTQVEAVEDFIDSRVVVDLVASDLQTARHVHHLVDSEQGVMTIFLLNVAGCFAINEN